MKNFNLTPVIILVSFLLLGLFSCSQSIKVDLQIDNDSKAIQIAIKEFEKMAKNVNVQITSLNPDLIISGIIDSSLDSEEAYRVSQNGLNLVISGGGNAGLVYGLHYVKEQLMMGNREIDPIEESPAFDFRAIKFNLPWSSYRRSESLQLHHETARDTIFWEEFLNMMVENRFNKLTLWNLHPFNYLVRLEKYPEANSMSDEEFAEWQQFWTTLFRMAKDREIETYLVNWNIFVSPEFAKAHNVAQYSITHQYNVEKGDTSEIIKDYTRESVRAVIDAYPDLTGLGITLGEGMGGMTAEERQEWLLESFIGGVRMASRKIKFIYRVPLSAGLSSDGSTSVAVEEMTRATLDTLTCFDGPIHIELKYNWSHAFSTPHLVKVHGGELSDTYWNPLPENYSLAWMLRNEDFFMLRWGQPDFIRQHAALNLQPYINGYFVGSETYIPAKDYITAVEGASYRYAFERQWMYYKVCGRLLYNPDTPDKVFKDAFEYRFPGHGEILFNAQKKVSRVPLIIASYQNAGFDFSLYSEGMLRFFNIRGNRFLGLIPLTGMANRIPMDPAYMSIHDFLENENNLPTGMITPVQLADSLYSFCQKALLGVEDIKPGRNIDLLYEVSDIKTWANLGMYFSNKLKAAVEYKRFETTRNEEDLNEAIGWLTKAVENWHAVVEITEPIYDPVPLTHLNWNEDKYFHWSKFEDQVVAELEWLNSLKN